MCLLITLGEVSVLLVHVEGIGICLLTGDRTMIRLLTRYLEWLAELAIRLNATLICKMFLVKHSQTLEVLISFEYFMPIYFLEFNFLYAILAIRMVSYYWLKATRIDTVYLSDYAYIFVLIFIFGNHHVRRRVMLFVTH